VTPRVALSSRRQTARKRRYEVPGASALIEASNPMLEAAVHLLAHQRVIPGMRSGSLAPLRGRCYAPVSVTSRRLR
jgi:hypothetical protein